MARGLDLSSVLYLTRNGLLEPLGQSQVYGYLRGLSNHHKLTVVSFEKAADRNDGAAVTRMRGLCDAEGIRWLPQKFRSGPFIIAPVLSMLTMLYIGMREVLRGRARIIHARSYVPAAVALVVKILTGTPFIFDMRALWPEELVESKVVVRGSLLFRAIVWMEAVCLSHAAATVSLTRAAAAHLHKIYPVALAGKTIDVIPTCADLERFCPALPSAQTSTVRTYGCVGTVISGWFRLNWLADFFEAIALCDPDARFECITKDDPDRVRAVLGRQANVSERLEIYSLSPSLMHEAVNRQTASVMFFVPGLSKLGSCPTRMGEILGCGVPVVVNEGVGDVAEIVRKYRVGIVVEGNKKTDVDASIHELNLLLQDRELAARCRNAAVEVFSLEKGIADYHAIYQRIAR